MSPHTRLGVIVHSLTKPLVVGALYLIFFVMKSNIICVDKKKRHKSKEQKDLFILFK